MFVVDIWTILIIVGFFLFFGLALSRIGSYLTGKRLAKLAKKIKKAEVTIIQMDEGGDRSAKSAEDKKIDDIAKQVIENDAQAKKEEKQKTREYRRRRTEEIFQRKSVLNKIIIKKWSEQTEKGGYEGTIIIKKNNPLNREDVTIRTDEERLNLVLEGINLNIVSPKTLEEYVICSLKALATQGTSRIDNKERLREILKEAGTIIINPPEREQYIVTEALGELSKKKVTIRTNGKRLKSAFEKKQGLKEFNFKKNKKSLTDTLKELEEGTTTIYLLGTSTKKLPDSVFITVHNIAGLERVSYLDYFVDLTDGERNTLNDWIVANYSD